MKVIDSISNVPESLKPSVLALGAFDGVHRGHQYLISQAVERAKEENCCCGVFTFFPHPRQVLFPGETFFQLTTWKQRRRIFADLGLDFVFLQQFTMDFAQLHFKTFVKKYLVDGLSVKKVFVGSDFRFGREGMGDAASLSSLGRELDFEVHIVPPMRVDGTIISSTLIREKIKGGDIEEIKKYLGRYYTINGEVVKGMGLGRKLGYPTANLRILHPYTMPPFGVYGVLVNYGGKMQPGLAHLGHRPTFSLDGISFEVFLLDYNGDLYGKKLEVSFLCRIRDIVSFGSGKELTDQIKRDIASFKEWLKKKGLN